MDKRKGIILAIVLFLIIGLGTFVFAGGSDEGSGDGTITPQPDGGDDNDPTNPSDPTTEDDGNITEGEDREDTTRPTGGNDDTDGDELVTDGEGENNPTTPTVDYKALLDELANMVESATSKEDLAEAEQFRKDNNITEENVATLNDEDASKTYDEVIAILTDNDSPVVIPDDLNGSFTNKDSVAVEITDTTDVSYTLTINGEEVTDADLANLTEEGNYKLTVTDSAFNSTTITFTVDRTDPVLLVNGEEVENGETIYVNEDAKMTVDETNLESFTSNGNDRTESILKGSWTAQNDGPYNIVVTDKAGNKTTYKVVVDKTPIAVNHLYVLNNTHNDYNVSEENRYKVIGNGQDLYVEYVLKEEFTSNPILTIGGKEYEMTCDVASWNDELYKCDAHVTISEDMNLVNGEVIPFTITGVKDIAGNETVVTEKDTTVSDKYGKVVYDNDPAQSIWVYILNADEEHRTIIGNNQKLIVEINVNEELLVNPVITIGDYQVELTRRANDSRYIYSKTITIDADKMKLVHDENIAFTISVTDVAGNTTTLDNDNVTIHEENGYDQVKYDGKAPKYKQLGVLNVDHLRNDEDVTVAKTGDEIRVLFHFDEILDVNPKMTIGESKTVYELKLATDYENFAEYTYVADITLTEDMNLSDGALVYTIYGYADAAGNVGKTIHSTDSDIKTYSQYPGVKYDTTAGIIELNGESQIVLEAGIDEYAELGATVTDNIDGEKQLTPAYIHYSKNDDFIDEVPSVDYMKTGTYKIVYKYTDAAGNASVDANRPDHDYVIRTVIVKDETKPLLTLNGSSTIKLEYGVDEYNELGATVTDNVDAPITNLTPTQIKFNGKIIKDISSVKFDQIGTYKLTYTYTDSNGNVGVSYKNPELNGVVRTVIVKDETKPLLKLNGDSTIRLINGKDNYIELGATVTDNFDAPITNLAPTQIKFNGKIIEDISSVKFDQIGTYKLTYTYTDSNGNVGVSHKNPELNSVVRTVIVMSENTTSLVDGVGYESLKDAVNAALSSGSTVELLNDVVSSESINITAGKELTLDLNGNDISFDFKKNFTVSGGTLNLIGEGTVRESSPYFGPIVVNREFMQGNKLTINVGENVTLEGYSGIFIDKGKAKSAMNTTINFKGKINSIRDVDGYSGYAIYVNGDIKNKTNYPIINIYEGSEIKSVGMGIYAAGYAEWNIYGGSIEAPGMAIGIKAGKLNISGGTFKATGELNIPTKPDGNGINDSGSVLQIESNCGYAQNMEINISGGTFISENAAAIYEYPDDTTTSVKEFVISGGTFISNNYDKNFVFGQSFISSHNNFMSNISFNKENSVLDSYLAEGYIIEPQADGSYKIVQG